MHHRCALTVYYNIYNGFTEADYREKSHIALEMSLKCCEIELYQFYRETTR